MSTSAPASSKAHRAGPAAHVTPVLGGKGTTKARRTFGEGSNKIHKEFAVHRPVDHDEYLLSGEDEVDLDTYLARDLAWPEGDPSDQRSFSDEGSEPLSE